MSRKFLIIFLMGLIVMNCLSCSKEDDDPKVIEAIAYILNGLASTISVINSDNSVANDVVIIGTYPNDLLLDNINQKLYVVNSGDNNIQVIDMETLTTDKYIDIGVGSNPYSMAMVNENRAIVTKLLTASVALVDLTNGAVIDTLAVGTAPEGVVVKDNMAYVANSAYGFGTGTISVIDIINWQVADTIEVGINPQTVFFDSQGELNVICTGNYADTKGYIYVIDITTNTIKTAFSIGGFPAYYAMGDNGIIYITAAGGWPLEQPGYLMSYDSITEIILHNEADPLLQVDNLFGLALHPKTHKIWACHFGNDQIYEIDPTDGNILQRFNVGDGPQVIRFIEE